MAETEGDKLVCDILARLGALRARWKRVRLLTGLAATGAVVTSVIAIAALTAGYWPDQPPIVLRLVLLATAGTSVAAAAAWLLVRELLRKENAAQTARRLENRIPALRNDLINSVLLGGQIDQSSRDLVMQALLEARGHLRRTDVSSSVPLKPLRRWGAALAAVCVAVIALGVLQPSVLKRGLFAIVRPSAHVPALNGIQLVSLSPGDATVLAGERVSITAVIRNEQALDRPAEVVFEGSKASEAMAADSSKTTYICDLGRMEHNLRYSVRIGGSRWPADKCWYELAVLSRVEVDGLDVRYEYPPYTSLPAREISGSDGHLEAPTGSKGKLTLRLAQPVAAATIELSDGKALAMAGSLGGTSFGAELDVNEDGWYRIVLQDNRGSEVQRLPEVAEDVTARASFGVGPQDIYRIRALPDSPPTVEFLIPGRDVALQPGDKLAMRIKASDKYGLTDLQLEAWQHSREQQLVRKAFDVAADTELLADYEFAVPADHRTGESTTIVYRATATDNRDLPGAGPQTVETGEFRITIADPSKVSRQVSDSAERLRRKLLEILKAQLGLRVDTEICWRRHRRLEEALSAARQIGRGQTEVRAEMLGLVESFPFPAELSFARQTLSGLAGNEAQLAIDQAAVLARLSSLSRLGPAATSLADTQDSIIEAIQTLLALIPAASQSERLAEGRPTAGEPSWPRAELLDLKAGLIEFAEHERKAIEAAQGLAETPADNFQPAQQELLKELIAAQDKWESFLDEAFADLAKLPAQDFSNPVTLKELISIKSDVTMAADALSKEAIEIATACESNGIENAESLTANIEKWLPDEPDRTKWVMEDPTEQANIEQAELPTELEDIVGDLLEAEEDLFEEMDDITSKYAMGGDKAIGWNAMDGPISNMNAQGVTGNQLPNTSELAGRSGEGRTGKSSGEFVEDKAVGKGGRRTPTRLTGEPFQRGQVNDISQEPPGGATGGGKLSGAGREGLEGPLPPELRRELERLAGRQADLVHRSQRAALMLQSQDYTNFAFLQAVLLMNRVHGDLRDYRYLNALRRRDPVLRALRDTKAILKGEGDVVSDSSVAMPKYIRQYIADAAATELPAGFRQPLRQYYKKLSEQSE